MHQHHDHLLSVLALVLAIVGSGVSLYMLRTGRSQNSAAIDSSNFTAAIAFAAGCWAMHFVSMMEAHSATVASYDAQLVLLPFFLMLLGTYPALAVFNSDGVGKLRLALSIGLLALAICAMHYLGMRSEHEHTMTEYDRAWVATTIALALLASYGGLRMMQSLQRRRTLEWWRLAIMAIMMGVANGLIHDSAMESMRMSIGSPHIHQGAAAMAGMQQGRLSEMLVGVILLAILVMMVASMRQTRIRVWNTLLMVGISELSIMMLMPVFMPSDSPVIVVSLVDVGLLMLLLFPVAWRLQRTDQHLGHSRLETEKNLAAQGAVIELLTLPLDHVDSREMLDDALSIVCRIEWLGQAVVTGVIFLKDAHSDKLVVGARRNLQELDAHPCRDDGEERCHCKPIVEELRQQCQSRIVNGETIGLQVLAQQGHCLVPLLFDQQLQGVLGFYLLPDQQFDAVEIRLLETVGAALSGMLHSKQNLDRLLLANTVFEHNLTCLIITDAENRILDVNPVFSKVTGYSAEEVLGRDPAVLKSGRHDRFFYAKLWEELHATGSWQGEIWNKNKDGTIYPVWLAIAIVSDQKGRIQNYIGAFADISEHKHAEEQIRQLAYYDSLTGLANRSLFYDRLEQAMIQARRDHGKLALLFIDLDRFKEVNDSLGHEAGDTLLKNVAARIRGCLRESDVLARLGGDEFVVLLKDMPSSPGEACMEICRKISENIIRRLSEGHDFERYTFYGGGSIGIVIYPDDATSIGDLIQRADTAMYEAKNAGRNTYSFFNPELGRQLESRLAIGHALRQAIDRKELSLVYQPLVSMQDQRVIGAEVLLRWHNEELGQVSPVDFIPLAEESGVIVQIGEWVIQQACQQLLEWQRKNKPTPNYLAINVSIHQLKHKDFADRALTLCRQFNIDPSQLELEITEGGLAQYPDQIAEILRQLRQGGFRLAIDDFGTDYSSLGRLKSFNADLLKIDRSFVFEMTSNPDDVAIVQAIIDMGRALGLETLAEGVETSEQCQLLQRLGCMKGQGYLFGKPMPAEAFEKRMLEQWQALQLENA